MVVSFPGRWYQGSDVISNNFVIGVGGAAASPPSTSSRKQNSAVSSFIPAVFTMILFGIGSRKRR